MEGFAYLTGGALTALIPASGVVKLARGGSKVKAPGKSKVNDSPYSKEFLQSKIDAAKAGLADVRVPVFTKEKLSTGPSEINSFGMEMKSLGEVRPQLFKGKGDGTGNKIDSDTIKKYIRDIEGRTGRKLPKNQIEKLKEALRNKEYKKMSPIETAKHRAEFDKVKNKVIKEREENTGQKWPVYNENVISEKTGKIIRKQGDKYDAHHIIENSFGGDHEWWNMHPAKFPNEHQAGIHGAGSPANTLFKGGKK